MSWDLVSKLWAEIDTNGDGELSVKEVCRAQEEGILTSRVVATIDINQDGAISHEEIEIAKFKARLATASKHEPAYTDIQRQRPRN